jgi:hypothetical protein
LVIEVLRAQPVQLTQSITHALQEREVRRIREEIARELAELEAARKQIGAPEKK